MEKSVVKDGESHHRSRRTTVLMDMVKAARKTGNREGTFLKKFSPHCDLSLLNRVPCVFHVPSHLIWLPCLTYPCMLRTFENCAVRLVWFLIFLKINATNFPVLSKRKRWIVAWKVFVERLLLKIWKTIYYPFVFQRE